MMSPAEYLELMSMASANTGQHAMATTSVLFAYLIAAYLVGSSLSRFQVFTISSLYSIYFTLPVLATLGEQRRIQNLGRRFLEEFPEEYQQYYETGSALEYMIVTSLLVSFIAWALSIYFMYDCRKKNLKVKSM